MPTDGAVSALCTCSGESDHRRHLAELSGGTPIGISPKLAVRRLSFFFDVFSILEKNSFREEIFQKRDDMSHPQVLVPRRSPSPPPLRPASPRRLIHPRMIFEELLVTKAAAAIEVPPARIRHLSWSSHRVGKQVAKHPSSCPPPME